MPEGNSLATLAINAHGGLDRWRQLKTVSARLLQGVVLLHLKGQNGVLDDVHVTVALRKEWASHRPFGQPDRRSSFQTKHTIVPRQPDGSSAPAPVVVSIDISEIDFE